jgi:DUF1680 family protein
VETFSKLADSIYFHDDAGVWVNLYAASALDWAEKGLRLRQQTRFPEEPSSRIAIEAAPTQPLALRLRIPAWADGASVALNGKPVRGTARPGSYVTVERKWTKGDRVDVRLPMSLRSHAMPDDASLQTMMYGPLVLAGDLGSEGLTDAMRHGDPVHPVKNHFLVGDPVPAPDLESGGKPPARWIRPGNGPLHFTAPARERRVDLLPLNRIVRQRYAVYWRVTS